MSNPLTGTRRKSAYPTIPKPFRWVAGRTCAANRSQGIAPGGGAASLPWPGILSLADPIGEVAQAG